jgi:hypothetical protein
VPPEPAPEADRSVGELVFDVSERVTLLVREEVALAKAEVTEKLMTLGRGAGIAAAAGVFLLAAGIMLMFAIAWLINDILGIEGSVWVGFAIEAGILVILAAVAGLIAKSLFGKVESPTPDMAIEELKETKETLGKTP